VRSLQSLTLGALLLSACEPNPNVDFFQPVTAVPSFPGTPGDAAQYQSYFAYTPNPSCVPRVPRRLDRRTEVRLFVGNDIAPSEIGRYAGGLKRYYDFYGVDMFTRYEPIPVPIDHAIVLNDAAIADYMRDQADVDPSCLLSYTPTTACERAYGAGMFYNVKQFLRAYAEPDRNVINLVLLKRVASLDPTEENALLNWGIAGLGLSQALLDSAAESDVGISLKDILDEAGFSPTVFIAVNLTDFILKEPDIVVAHEFGHAYSLEHLDPDVYGENLMNPSAEACDLSLNSSQLDTIEEQTARFGNVLDPARYRGPEILSFTDRYPEILQIMRARVAAHASGSGGTP
jgi:hypothetical protein